MPRVLWDEEVEVEVAGQRVPCQCVDISQTGVRLRGSWSTFRGQKVKLSLPVEGEPVVTEGEVVWSSKSPDEGWGVRFTSVQPIARRRLARFVIARLRERPQDEVPPPAVSRAVPWSTRPKPARPGPPPWQQVARAPVPGAPTDQIPTDPTPRASASPSPSAVPQSLPPDLTPWDKPEPAEALPVLPCTQAMRSKLQELLDSGLASGSIIGGAKEAMGGRGDLFIRVDTGPVVVLPGNDPLSGRLRWLAAAVATWSGSDEPRLEHGPHLPLRIKV